MTELVFVGTGPTSRIPVEGIDSVVCESARRPLSRDRRLQSSLFLSGNENILINVTEDIEKQIAIGNISEIDSILITNGLKGSVGGLANLNRLARGDKTPIFLEEETYRRVLDSFSPESLDKFDINFIESYKSFRLGGKTITPIRMPCSKTSEKYPNFGFLFEEDNDKYFYCSDTNAPSSEKIPKESKELLKDVDVLIWDGGGWDEKVDNHCSIKKTLPKLLKDFDPKVLMFTQIGLDVPVWKDTVREIKGIDSRANVVFDGLRLKLENLLNKTGRLGFGLYDLEAEKILNGEKKEICLDKQYFDFIGKELYLFGEDKIYGIIYLFEPKEEDKDFVFSFDFKPFDVPKDVILPDEKTFFIDDFKLIEELLDKRYEDYIKTIGDISKDILIKDHKILNKWYSKLEKNKEYKLKNGWNKEDIWNAHKLMIKELKKRGLKNTTPIKTKLLSDIPKVKYPKEKYERNLREGLIDQVLESFVSEPFWDKDVVFLYEQVSENFTEHKQEDFKNVIERGVPRKWILQWHERGASNHSDMRFDVGEHLQGFTITEPANVTKKNILTNKLLKTKKLNVVDKPIQPKAWLKVHGVAPIGDPGATKELPGIFTIMSKGIYLPEIVEDHKICLLIHSDDFKIKVSEEARRPQESSDFPKNSLRLEGRFQFSIAHLGDKYVWLFYKLKNQENLPYWIDKKIARE